MHSIADSALTEAKIASLIERAHAYPWPESFQPAMLLAFERRDFNGILLKEYVPEGLVNGRMALVGDAVHLATSWTGMGFNAALQDVLILAEKLAAGDLAVSGVLGQLLAYEAERLAKVRALVQGGQRFTWEFREE